MTYRVFAIFILMFWKIVPTFCIEYILSLTHANSSGLVDVKSYPDEKLSKLYNLLRLQFRLLELFLFCSKYAVSAVNDNVHSLLLSQRLMLLWYSGRYYKIGNIFYCCFIKSSVQRCIYTITVNNFCLEISARYAIIIIVLSYHHTNFIDYLPIAKKLCGYNRKFFRLHGSIPSLLNRKYTNSQ